MIDLHTHTSYSDGAYSLAEHIRRAEQCGYRVIGITDHGDASNVESIIQQVKKGVEENNKFAKIKAICGIELTHVLPESIGELVKQCRAYGAQLVNVHGETIVEPVPEGTNMAAIDAGVDVLCHPGFITEEEAAYAAEKGVFLEITSRAGHSFTNAHVFRVAKATGAKLVFDNDAHTHSDLVSQDLAEKIMLGCGIPRNEIPVIFAHSEEIARRLLQGLFI
ncbi:MAG: PHP domain-containing protein [Candidatus Raymondbacteria bacterium RifOxyA12_full_50_37]|uniref:PHP domain-containing protein n=1 Tax=Candidatus Raymondbacteria bacterium RIFOXYD12_FULL_49_13 TaxID=1817890 RepID=A0A1F7FKG9_UNCRA|nr:MAG: PHP domain-containing protein [Candidatus Raymondbacteria bacterium RifOxyA12_full_50_37]OGJ90181.1 MAG: PHP domain-containing protein [Candidatus Raymondbacteria bacterium RIFOXYA2_FULL_49_16]OGJ97253.1 MAG: PHP domain-containing protein [Candidatus Raymondbacteria bacterium RIFOXYC2_FULL_50_21]OGJ98830.1 MAG: PHP domain-containing protein [Candidatus Raymondbacteria bacterium RifOxyB12_full_50_8]OGK07118.1 MAG: PHP domain-containing protein [Candidatus Raymondbacteria bacterium RIFOXY